MSATEAPPRATCRMVTTPTRYLLRWHTADPELWPELLRDFRATFPRHGDAVWRTADKCWSVPRKHRRRLERWSDTWFPGGALRMEEADAGDLGDDEPPPKTRRRLPATVADHDPLATAYAALHLLPTAPPELVQVAHRWAARAHHPDRGGTAARMSAINAAIETIRAHQKGE